MVESHPPTSIPSQPLRNFLVPTTTDAYRNARIQCEKEHSSKLEQLRQYADALRGVLQIAHDSRLALLHHATDQLATFNLDKHGIDTSDLGQKPLLGPRMRSEATAVSQGGSKEQLLKEICESIEVTSTIRRHLFPSLQLKEVQEDISNYEYLIKTQATASITEYRGLRDWAEGVLEATSDINNNLVIVSLAGTGLVYATIFSANRGDIGMMAFTFPLFSLGFLVPAVAQIALKWASNRSRRATFASQGFWRVFIALWLTLAVLAVVAAIAILNLTVFLLPKDKDAVTDRIPRAAGVIAFAISGIILVFLFGAFILALFAKGVRRVTRLVIGKSRGFNELENYDFA